MPRAYPESETQTQSKQIHVSKYWECIREEGEKCLKWREAVYVRGVINIDAFYGEKYKQCIPIFQNKVKVSSICTEGQVILGNWILDGKFAQLIKAILEQIPEGWHNINEPNVKLLIDTAESIIEQLANPSPRSTGANP